MAQNALLNSFLDPKEILRDLEIKFNRVPDITVCPTCHAPEFYIGLDPAGGGWYACNNCCWTGDSPQLISRIRGVSIEETLLQLRRYDRMDTLNDHRIGEYLNALRRRESAKDFWFDASDRLSILSNKAPAARKLLHAYRLDEMVQRMTWNNQIGQIVGLTTKETYTRCLDPSGRSALRGRPNHSYVVSPLFDAPGRIAGVATFDIGQGQKLYGHTPLPYGTSDAMMFLNSVYMYDEVVYALPDLAFALALQVKSHEGLGGALPVIGITPMTHMSWVNVRPQRVVFWDRTITDELFLAARHVSDRAYIALKPVIDDIRDPFWHMREYTPRQFVGMLHNSAVPWLQALKDYVLAVSYGEASALFSQLDLMPSQRQEMMKYCTSPSERRRVSALVDIGVIDMRVPMTTKNQYLVQKSDGWYMQSRSGADMSTMSKAIPVIETFTNFKTHTVLTGHIRANGRVIPFEIPKEEYTADWLDSYCFQHGAPSNVHSRIRRDLLHYTLEFNNPVEKDGLDSIGWDGEAFVFPRFVIRPDGRVLDSARPLARPHPMRALHYSSRIVVDNARAWTRNTPAHALFWALTASLTANILAPAEGFDPRGIALLGHQNDDQDGALRTVVEHLHLSTYDTANKRRERSTIDAILAHESEHSVPLHVHCEDMPIVLKWMQAEGPRNAITTVTPGVRKPLLLRGGWTIVDSPPVNEVLTMPNGSAIVPSLLVNYCQNGMKLPKAKGHPVFGVIEMIKHWLALRFGLEMQGAAVLAEAKRMLEIGTPDGAAGMFERFVGTLVHLLEEGAVTISQLDDLAGTIDPKAAVTRTSSYVYLNYEVLRRVFDKKHLYLPEAAEMSRAFFEQKVFQSERYGLNSIEGWYVDPEKWDAALRRWSS